MPGVCRIAVERGPAVFLPRYARLFEVDHSSSMQRAPNLRRAGCASGTCARLRLSAVRSNVTRLDIPGSNLGEQVEGLLFGKA